MDESLDTGETCDLFLPFLCGEDGVDDRREDCLDGVGVHGLDDGQSSCLGGVLDRNQLVTNGGEDIWEEDDQIWLDGGRGIGVLSNGLDGIESAFADSGILLVAELLLQRLDGPAVSGVSIAENNFLNSSRQVETIKLATRDRKSALKPNPRV